MSNSTRLRKRKVQAPAQVINFTKVRGHTTNPPPDGTMTDVMNPCWMACLHSSTEWCEDVNHRENYSLSEDPLNVGVYTIQGTMTTRDRGSPLWIRRATRTHTPGWAGEYRSGQGVDLGNSGNWSTTIQTGHQMIGGASYGSGFANNVANPPSFGGSVPSKTLINFGFYGPKGWKQYQPLNPKVSTTQFLAELRDLPRIPLEMFRKASFFKALGHEYLNLEFGWKPFYKDVKDFLKAVLNFNERYHQLLRDNGKAVHREGDIYKTEDTTSSVTTGTGEILTPTYDIRYYGGSTALANTPWSKTVVTQTSVRYWFSGTFRYWLAPFDTTRFHEQMYRIVYGVDLSPRLFWELMPWSWLIDWSSSIGDSIANFTEIYADGLVAEYAYCMGHYRSVTTETWKGPLTTAYTSLINEIKARDQATPYGFGLNTTDFSNGQKAILAALALARM